MGIDVKLKALNTKMKTNSSHLYKVFLSIFFSLTVLFCSSKLWLPSDVKILNTSIGTEYNTSPNISLKLRSWEYSKVNQLMVITFDVHNNEQSQSLKFLPTARTNVDKKKKLNTYTVLNYDGTLIMEIKNVPTKWDILSLWIQDNTEQGLQATSKMNGAHFYCDIRKVVLNDSLKTKSHLAYQIDSVIKEITDVKNSITDFNNQIRKENIEINQLNFDITAIQDSQKYQTKEEVQKSNSVISSKRSEIKNHQSNIQNLQQKISDAKMKLEKLNVKLADVKNGKVSVPSNPTASNKSIAEESNSSVAESVD